MSLVSDLVALLGADRVRDDPLERRLYGKDAGVTRGRVLAVALPETTREVATCVRIARRHRIPVVARGAGTGLAGGAAPSQPALVVSLMRMNRIWEIDESGRTATVGPGVVNLDLTRHTGPLGLHFAPDPSSQSVCTIGGNVATNAGGPHCLADGTTVAHVLGVELVTADGDVIQLGGAAPDPPGLDLTAVVVGSEGTLGIVTRVVVALTEDPPDLRTLLLSFPDVAGAARTVSATIAAGIVPAALEMMDAPMIAAVEEFAHAGYPTEAGAVLLAEVAGHPVGVSAEAGIIDRIGREAGASGVRIAEPGPERDLLWHGRKSAFGAVAQAAPDYYLHDTVVPRTRLVDVLTELYAVAERHDLLMLNVFHAGDGNLHPLMAFDGRQPGVWERVEAAGEEIVRVSIAAGGMLTGEHGVGIEKRDLMGEVFRPVDLDAQARLREAFDPVGIMNPGKILPAGSRCFDFDLPGVAAS